MRNVQSRTHILKSSARAAGSLRLLAFVIVLLSCSHGAWAFMESEEQQFQADIDEAKKRAHDFERTLERIAREDEAREKAGSEIGKWREKAAAERESIRREFVDARDRRPDQGQIREQQEKAYLERQEEIARVMEKNRKEYVAKRDHVRRVIEREAYIDQAREYGL